MGKTTLKDGMIYHKITKDLYIKHKQSGWTDRRISNRYGMHPNGMAAWKQDNFTAEEIKALSLRGKSLSDGEDEGIQKEKEVVKQVAVSTKNNDKVVAWSDYEETLKKLKVKVKENEDLKLEVKEYLEKYELEKKNRALQLDGLVTEKELAYQKSQGWYNRFKELETEHSAVKERKVSVDRDFENEKEKNREIRDVNIRLSLQIQEMKRLLDPMRMLVNEFTRDPL